MNRKLYFFSLFLFSSTCITAMHTNIKQLDKQIKQLANSVETENYAGTKESLSQKLATIDSLLEIYSKQPDLFFESLRLNIMKDIIWQEFIKKK